jgi:hypothetical protein
MYHSRSIIAEVESWPGVSVGPHRFGGLEFRVGRRQLGHLHGEAIADIPLPRALRDELVAEGRVQPHRWRGDSGWVTVPIDSPSGAAEAVRLLRLGYGRAIAAQRRATEGAAANSPAGGEERS